MPTESLQRTLIIGLGEAGLQLTDYCLAHLEQTIGPLNVVAGVGLGPATAGPESPAFLKDILVISAETGFTAWQTDFARLVEAALRRISRLAHLTDLARRGLSLLHPDELHLILAADLTVPWVCRELPAIIASLQHTVARTLACHLSLTGCLLLLEGWPPAETEWTPANVPTLAADGFDGKNLPALIPHLPVLISDLPAFERGCFVVSATNEVGLVVGEGADLLQRIAHFLSLLVTSPLGMAILETAWPAGTMSLGMAVARWPGRAVAEALSARWTGEVLEALLADPETAASASNPERALRRLLAGERLAPPLLLETLTPHLPPLPDGLLDEVPDPPWPWLMVDCPTRLTDYERRWLADWSGQRPGLEARLAGVKAAWPAKIRAWLAEYLSPRPDDHPLSGALPRIQAYLAAGTNLLTELVEGVTAQLEATAADLAETEAQIQATAQSLDRLLKALPASLPEALVRWGWRPLRWPAYWATCQKARSLARQLAHLLRARLVAQESVWLYQEILPLYRGLAQSWADYAGTWAGCRQQVTLAGRSPALKAWPADLATALKGSGGPWTVALVEGLYEAIEALSPAQSGSVALAHWAADGLTAAAIDHELHAYARQALAPIATWPIDLALRQQVPDEAALVDWLVAFLAQARPFWPYDETALPEAARSQARLQTWLLLPEGEASPLAPLCQHLSQPPTLLAGQEGQALAAVAVRRGLEQG